MPRQRQPSVRDCNWLTGRVPTAAMTAMGNAAPTRVPMLCPVADQTPRGPAGFKDERREALHAAKPPSNMKGLNSISTTAGAARLQIWAERLDQPVSEATSSLSLRDSECPSIVWADTNVLRSGPRTRCSCTGCTVLSVHRNTSCGTRGNCLLARPGTLHSVRPNRAAPSGAAPGQHGRSARAAMLSRCPNVAMLVLLADHLAGHRPPRWWPRPRPNVAMLVLLADHLAGHRPPRWWPRPRQN